MTIAPYGLKKSDTNRTDSQYTFIIENRSRPSIAPER